MTIALDATYSIGEELSGVGLYSREILFGLAAAHPEARFDWFYRPHRYFRSWREKLPRNARRRLAAGGADLFHGLNQRLPQVRMRRTAATFHDLFVLTGDYSTAAFRARFAEQARDAAARADRIIAVSAFTKQQVVELLGVEESRVSVVHHGTRRISGRISGTGNETPKPREFRCLSPKFVLSVGAIQKRKNIARLVEAFEGMDADWRLVLAGSYGYGAETILARIEASPARERILVPGYVSPGELAAWYGRAMIFAFPSLDEGFGMPLLEAMAAGVPAITSNRSALPEVAGDAALLVDPEDTGALAHALNDLARNEALQRELAEKGLARARLFTWEKAVAQTWDIYRKLNG